MSDGRRVVGKDPTTTSKKFGFNVFFITSVSSWQGELYWELFPHVLMVHF